MKMIYGRSSQLRAMFKVASIEIPEMGLGPEEIYELLFAEPETRPDYSWMNPRPRPPHKAKEAKAIREYRSWIKEGGPGGELAGEEV